jgi:transcription antitermination factor NusG
MKNTQNNWFVLYTKPRSEKKVALALTSRQIENFCPLYKDKRKWSDRIKTVELPLFSSYVFVKVPEKELVNVKQIYGVVNILYYLKKPAIVRDQEIEAIKWIIDKHESFIAENNSLAIHQKIKITSGVFNSEEAEIIEIGKSKIKVFVKSVGLILELNLDRINK